MFDTPILFIIFNRPDTTRRVFERLREIQPSKLYVAADGPRDKNFADHVNCRETREIINEVDWNCEVKTLFRAENKGCGRGVSDAISWFFEQEEQGIILEDDCIPNDSFFRFCKELLDRYKNDKEVFCISGDNFQAGKKHGDASYYFSALAHVWGWATWRRAWSKYDYRLSDYDRFLKEKKLERTFSDPEVIQHYQNIFSKMHNGEIDTWDFQWHYCILNHGAKSIIPNENLVTNIGFGNGATHTVQRGIFAELPVADLSWPLVHPLEKTINKEADRRYLFEIEKFYLLYRRNDSRLYQLKLKVVQTLEFLLFKFYLSKTHRSAKKAELIIKPDAIGDFIICRNLVEYYVKHPQNQNKDFYLLVSVRLKGVIDEAYAALFKEVIYLDESLLAKFKTQTRFYLKIHGLNLSRVIYLVYSRVRKYDEIIRISGAAEKIGINGDHANQSPESRRESDPFYSQLITLEKTPADHYLHEFNKIKRFFEILLHEPVKVEKPVSNLLDKNVKQEKLILIFPGAQHDSRRWPPVKYAELINRMAAINPGIRVAVYTGPHEENVFKEIQAKLNVEIQHAHALRPAELAHLTQSALLAVGSDSAPAHLCASLNKHYVCLSNANHIGRFMPYPENMHIPQTMIFPEQLEEVLNKHPESKEYFYKGSNLRVEKIKTEQVLNTIADIISKTCS